MEVVNTLPAEVLVALAMNRKETARSMLVKLVKEDPSRLAVWLGLAVVLPREQAIQALRRALRLDPDNQLIIRNLHRLRDNPQPGFSLILSDFLSEEETSDADAPNLFGHEQPTQPLPKLPAVAEFGDEAATMPTAFHSLFSGAKVEDNPGPGLSSLLFSYPGLLLPEEMALVGAGGRPPGKATATLEMPKTAPPRPRSATLPEVVSPPPIAPHRPSVPAKTETLPRPPKEKSVLPGSPLSSPLSLPNLHPVGAASAPRRSPTRPLITPPGGIEPGASTIVSGAYNRPPAPVSKDGKSFQPTFPRLETGERPPLGMAPAPMFGFTSFGLVVLVLVIVVLVLVFLLLSGASA